MWFSVAELAAEKLPGLPGTPQNVSRKARDAGWDAGQLARKRAGRGGGLEYHYEALPKAAQAALARRYGQVAPVAGLPVASLPAASLAASETAPAKATDSGTLWAYYEARPAAMKKRAQERLEILLRVATLSRRLGSGAAVKAVAEEEGLATATLYNWRDRVHGLDKADWLPALVPAARGGGGRPVEVDEAFWDAFRADYLRLSEPSVNSVYYRCKRLAKTQGWAVPNLRTLRRRVAEIPEAVLVMARQGRDATKALYPAEERDRGMFHALQCVNVDGHKWDVFVRWEDGSVGRPMMVAFQDLYSNMFLSWRMDKSENKDAVRLALGDMVSAYGIPDDCWMDNGRAFASKWLTGGTKNRYRFKVKAEEPDGMLTQIGTRVHWTTPFAGQSKPIERAFGDFCDAIAKHPAFDGAYTGNSPMAKPEDYGAKAVPIEIFRRVVDQEIAAHNAREGRTTKVCGGRYSFQQAFDASYANALIRRATPEQCRMFLLAHEGVTVRRDGLHLLGNRYWNESLLALRGEKLTVRFDPENVHDDLAVYARDGRLLCVAQLIEAVGFADTEAARTHAQARKSFVRATAERLAAERKMSLAQLAALQPALERHTPPEPKLVRPIFRGNLAMKPASETAADIETYHDHFAAGLRLVKRGDDI